MGYQLTITPLKISDIPSEDDILTAARELLDSVPTWKEGKSYVKHTVKTYFRPKGPGDGANWHCRVSEHSKEDATFDEFWSKLAIDKAQNEMQFIPDIQKVTEVKNISPTQSIWSLFYKFSPPVSPRVFTVLQVINRDESSPRTGIIVSIPMDFSGPGGTDLVKLEVKGVKGRYVSVERIKELDNGKVQWSMATSSSPGGNIPQFLAEKTMPSMISEDVPHFLKWLHSTRSTVATDLNTEANSVPPAINKDDEYLPGSVTAAHTGGGGAPAI